MKPNNQRNIYNRSNELALEVKKLAECNISEQNKEAIRRFQTHLQAKNRGKSRIAKLMRQLRILSQELTTPWYTCTREDIERLVSWIHQREDLAEATKQDYRRIIRQWHNWYEEVDPRLESADNTVRNKAIKTYRYISKHVKGGSAGKQIDFSMVLTLNDIQHVVNKGARTIKEKALIMVLYETGVRVGELLGMRLQDIEMSDTACRIRVSGKTGQRSVTIVNSVPLIQQWLVVHPFKDTPEQYLWLSESLRWGPSPLKYVGVKHLIRRCFKRAELTKKPHNPHWFRHSRASFLSERLAFPQFCMYFGWTQDSRSPRKYIHLNPKSTHQSYMRMMGVMPEEREDDEKPPVCRCGKVNSIDSRYCYVCGSPLSVDIAVQDEHIMQQQRTETMEYMFKLLQDPEMREKLEEFRKRLADK